MDIRKLQRAIVDGLEDVKAQNIVVFNTEHLSPLFERVIIASGTSNRQTKALASSVRDAVKSRGMDVLRTEGEDNGEWIIVDCGAAVAHIMQPSIRDYYHLEEIWGGKPVKLKLGGVDLRLPKAAATGDDEEEDDEDAPPAPARKAPAKKAAAKKAAAKKVAATRSAADQGAAKRGAPVGAAPKRAPAKKAASRTAAAPQAAAKAPRRPSGSARQEALDGPTVAKAPKAPARRRTGA